MSKYPATGNTPNFFITKENFSQLIGPGFWQVNDIPPARLNQIGMPFAQQGATFAVFASGYAPRPLEKLPIAPIGGIDWVKLEKNPRATEPPLNVYHYVIGEPNASGYPVWGPFLSGSIAPHWSDLKDMDGYF